MILYTYIQHIISIAHFVGLLPIILDGVTAYPYQLTHSISTRSISPKTTAASSYVPDWTSTPTDSIYAASRFGGVTTGTGSGDEYCGNVGDPYGSNIIEIPASEASKYKYVVQFQGNNKVDWTVVIWNKCTSDHSLRGSFGNATMNFTLGAGSIRHIAFDEDSQGGWAAAQGTQIPTNSWGQYASTWGEFDFGSKPNSGSSGFDVSEIIAKKADMVVQGMRVCDALGSACSTITKNGKVVINAYTPALADQGGIGGNLYPGPVRLTATLDY